MSQYFLGHGTKNLLRRWQSNGWEVKTVLYGTVQTICGSNTGVLGSRHGLATYFRFSFRFFKKGSCQLLAKVCARSTG